MADDLMADAEDAVKAEDAAVRQCLFESGERLDAPISSITQKWRLLPAFLRTHGLVKQHLVSYNHLLDYEMEEILLANALVTVNNHPNFYMKFIALRIGEPSVDDSMAAELTWTNGKFSPQECRLRDITYSAPIRVDIEYTQGESRKLKRNVTIGRMPIMLKSNKCILNGRSDKELMRMGECACDPGGYFVVKGSEKVILVQEQLSKNRVIIDKDAKGEIRAAVTSSTVERKSKTYMVSIKGKFYLRHSSSSEDIPIVIALKAMGVETDQEAHQLVGSSPTHSANMAASLQDAKEKKIYTANQALDYIGKRVRSSNYGRGEKSKRDEAKELLAFVVFAHVPVVDFDFRDKTVYCAQMLRRMIDAQTDPSQVDDMDYYGNKRLELSGQLLSLLFEDLFKKLIAEVRRGAAKELDKAAGKAVAGAPFDATRLIREDIITNGLVNSISTGNWTVKRFKMDRSGVTQVLSRLSFISALGMMTRVMSQFEKSRKVSGPRALQPSQWGMLCPSDTPEGEACGLVKNLALTTHVTTNEDEGPIKRLCYSLGVEDVHLFSPDDLHDAQNGAYYVALNGLIIGVHTRPHKLLETIRALRRRGIVGKFVSVQLHPTQRALHIATDSGRVCRPLIVVDRGKLLLTQALVDEVAAGGRGFDSLVRQGIIEYLDVNEENSAEIAISEVALNGERRYQYTHMEIDPLTILGVCAGLIPYPHHNQSPRNTYQCAMGKQAMGCAQQNYQLRFDTILFLLNYTQRPLVKTRTLDLIGYERVPAGHNATVAVMSYSGYDIEDALIVNKASLDRGFGRCMVFKKYATPIKRYANGASDQVLPAPPPSGRGAPTPTKGARTPRSDQFRCLDTDGIAGVGERLNNGDLLVNKYSPLNTVDEVPLDHQLTMQNARRAPLVYKGPEGELNTYVDRVLMSSNQHGKMIKVRVRSSRRPELGDKFSSRHGQKGVVGRIVPQEDMPFSERGICPDIIMNPHGFPSRMTVGKMIELLAGKAGALNGHFGDGTAFAGDTVEECGEHLIRHGYSYQGKDMLTSGLSGEPMKSYVFMGPIYYQKLKHMVMDKMHARARGPRQVLTRQPTEGRSREGGLRLGEMERDCLIGYGASMLLNERLMTSSDGFSTNVCETCGLLASPVWCTNCASSSGLRKLNIPYACKLLFQELQSMNIVPRLKLESE